MKEFEFVHLFSTEYDSPYEKQEAAFWPPVNTSLFPHRRSGGVTTSFGAEYTGAANVFLVPKGMRRITEFPGVQAVLFQWFLELYDPVGLRISGRGGISTFRPPSPLPSWYASLPPIRVFSAIPYSVSGNNRSGNRNNSGNSRNDTDVPKLRKVVFEGGEFDMPELPKDLERKLGDLFDERKNWAKKIH